MIPQRNISLLSNRLAAGGGLRIREDVLEQMAALPPFDQVFREMRRTFRQARLP